MRRGGLLVVVAAVAGLAAASCASSTSGGGPSSPSGASDFTVYNVLPPGELQARGVPSQETMYDRLNTVPPEQINNSTVGQYFKPGVLDPVKEDIVRTENPPQRPGVKIVWDRWGVPYIYGTTNDDVAWGSGWAGTQLRMFAMDYIRYAGAGRSAELVPVADAAHQDASALAAAAYTPQEAQQQIDALAASGPAGADAVSRIRAFVDGVNASRKTLCPTVTAKTCPKEYGLFKVTPKPFVPADIVYAAATIGGIYGKGGGAEAVNARWFAQLKQKFGAEQASKVLNDTLDWSDRTAAVTVPGEFPYGQNGDPDPAAVAVPDLKGPTAPGTGNLGPTAPEAFKLQVPTDKGTLYSLPLEPLAASNALLVSGDHTTTGKPLAVFGPQVGYQVPSLLQEEVLHGPNYNARGVAFVDLQPFILLGRGAHYAWSATSAYGDLVDTVVQRLCNANGTAPSVRSTSYVNESGTCTPFQTWTLNETQALTGKKISLPVMKTEYGIVQYRTTVEGKPVAIVTERSTYGDDISNAVPFMQSNDPAVITGEEAFRNTFAQLGYTFNWFYVDDRDIGVFTSGKLPLRAPGQDMALPRWGETRWNWQGWLPPEGHPQSVNPPSGFLANWNNKPAIGERAPDNDYGWTRVQRVLSLSDGLQNAIANGKKVDAGNVLGVVMNGATVDPRGAYLLPTLLQVLADDPQLARYTSLLSGWARSGAHRVDRARSGRYADQAAVALFDTWWPLAATAVMNSRLGDLAFQIPQSPLDGSPNLTNQGSAYANVAWYGYVDRDLRKLLGQDVTDLMSQPYCGNGNLNACRAALKRSLLTAVQQLETQQKQTDPAKWVYPLAVDDIKFTSVGLTSAPPIDWQNRPTWHQVVTSGPLPSTTPSTPPTAGGPSAAPGTSASP
jgi:acyl-homoserine lactone acylase PvdQ